MIIFIVVIFNIIAIIINLLNQAGGSNEDGERKHEINTGHNPCKGGRDGGDHADAGGFSSMAMVVLILIMKNGIIG